MIVLGHRICRAPSSSTFLVAAIVSAPPPQKKKKQCADLPGRCGGELEDGLQAYQITRTKHVTQGIANSSWGQREPLPVPDILPLCDEIRVCAYVSEGMTNTSSGVEKISPPQP